MRIIEIILKLAFLILAVNLFITRDFLTSVLIAFLVVSALLGLVLIFNKKGSYRYPAGYPKMRNVYITRRIEGGLLIAFAIVIFACVH